MSVTFNNPEHNISDTTHGVNIGPGSLGFWATVAVGGVILGAGGPMLAGAYARTAGVRLGLSYARKPFLTIMANHSKSGIVRASARGLLGVSKSYTWVALASTVANPFMSMKYAMRGDLKRAALSHYGPVGTVWVYNQHVKRFERTDPVAYRSVAMPSGAAYQPPKVTRTVKKDDGRRLPKKASSSPWKQSSSTKTIKKMSKKQKNRLWRMGLRWCPKHKRYDRCSLRVR